MNGTKRCFSRLCLLAGTAALFAVFALIGCGGNKAPVRTLPTVSQTDGPDGDPVYHIHKESEWECQINPGLPVYRFVLAREIDEQSSVCPNTLTVYDRQSGGLVQTLTFDSVVQDWNEEDLPPVRMVDADFDGYLDLVVHTGQGAGSVGTYTVYCWQACGTTGFQGFSPRPSLEYLNPDYQDRVYEDTHQFMTSVYQLVDGSDILYQVERADSYSRPEFRVVRYCDYGWNTDGRFRVMELTDTVEKCIYQGTCSSLNDSQSHLIENYLRFGVPDPITAEEALALAGETVPGANLEMVQMLTFGGKSYYHIRWTFGNQSGDCGVAADGSGIADCGGYLRELAARAVPAFHATGDTV